MDRKKILAALAVVLLAGCGSPKSKIDLIPAANRVSATEIKVNFLNWSVPRPTPAGAGKKSSPEGILGGMKGKVVILDFWATWCGPCRMEIPSLIKIHNDYHSKGVEILGLSTEVNDGQPGKYFADFISATGINYPIGLASVETLGAYGINPIPTTFFVDKSGKIALSFVGARPEGDFTAALEKLLAE